MTRLAALVVLAAALAGCRAEPEPLDVGAILDRREAALRDLWAAVEVDVYRNSLDGIVGSEPALSIFEEYVAARGKVDAEVARAFVEWLERVGIEAAIDRIARRD